MIDSIMSFVLDSVIFDNIWAGIVEAQYISAAGHVAFTLAFVTVLSTDDQATMASKRKARITRQEIQEAIGQ